MGLIEIIVALVIIGVILYLVKLIPMDDTIRKIIIAIIIIAVIIWLLNLLLGANLGGVGDIRIGGN